MDRRVAAQSNAVGIAPNRRAGRILHHRWSKTLYGTPRQMNGGPRLLRLVGIWGDPVRARRMIDAANACGCEVPNRVRLQPGVPEPRRVAAYRSAARCLSGPPGVNLPTHCRPNRWWRVHPVGPRVASGLPVVCQRSQCRSSSALTRLASQIPAQLGISTSFLIYDDGDDILVKRIEKRCASTSRSTNARGWIAYIWANAVPCPRTGRLVPLLTDKWLRKTAGKEAAVRMVTSIDGIELREPHFEVVSGT